MIRTAQNSFVSGEVAPQLYGRHDLKAYFNGAARIQNMVVRKAGGTRKRHGSDVLLDLSAYPGCRVIPFFYDRKTCVLAVFHGQKVYFIGKNRSGKYDWLKRYTGLPGEPGYYEFGTGSSWEVFELATQYADEDLPWLKSYQTGDTLFLTCRGYQACKLQRQADASFDIETMTGSVTVPSAPALTAAPSGFHDVSTTYPASTKSYALFAVKNGVVSEPSKATANITLPWIAGASVKLTFGPDLTQGIEGYFLGKKSGAYYGKISEVWPSREAVETTGKTYGTSGASTLSWADAWYFRDAHASELLDSDPNALAEREVKMLVHKHAFHLPRAGTADPSAEFYRSTSYTVGKVRVYFGAIASSPDRQNAVTVDYAAAAVPVKVEVQSGSTWITDSNAPAVVSGPGGYVEIAVAHTAAVTRLRLSFGVAAGDTGIVVRGIAVIDRSAAYVATGGWTLASAATAFLCAGVAGTTAAASNYGAALLDVTGDADGTDRDTLVEKSCVPARYVRPHRTPMALELYDSGSGVMAAMVKLTSSSVFEISEILLYPGAKAAALPLHTPGSVSKLTSNTAGCKIIYTTDGSTWTDLPTLFILSDQYADNSVSIQVPADTSESILTTAKGWGLKLLAADASKPVIIRGAKMFETVITGEFVDDNVTPGELIDAQTYIKPGSSDMDVETLAVWQQRIIVAASEGLPFTLWCSRVGDLENWYANRPMIDSDAFSVSIAATQASRIMHLLADRRMVVFTESGVYTVEGSQNEGFSYRTCRIEKVAGTGSCEVAPVGVQSSALYVASDGRTLTELRYDLSQDGLIPIDRSVLASHLTEESEILRLAWQPAPDGLLWLLKRDGTLLSFTFLPEHEVFAWARHVFAGGTAVVADIVAPGSLDETRADCDGTGDVFLVTEDGAGGSALEKMRPPVCADDPTVEDALCLDRMQVCDADASDTLTPAVAYPNGAVLRAVCLATGEERAAAGTAAGTVLLSGAAVSGRWATGYAVAAELLPLRPELPDRNVQAMAKNVVDAVIRVNRARGVSVTENGLAREVAYAGAAMRADGRVDLESRDVKLAPFGRWNDDGQMLVRCAGPWPAEILSVIFKMEIENR